jgi:hypothetical protein
MVASLAYNYMQTVNAAGAFTTSTSGGVQGTQMDDPETRWSLRGGVLSQSEVYPMYGGVGIYEQIPTLPTGLPTNPLEQLGCIVGRATTLTKTSTTGLSGFSLFNQAHHMPVTTTTTVPLSASGMSVHYQRLGSGARIWVACSPDLTTLYGDSVGTNVSWDFNAQRLTPASTSATIATSGTVTWASTSGGQLTFPVANWTGAWQPIAGDILTISGATNTGTGGVAAINTEFTVISATGTSVILAAPATAGVFGTIAGSPVLNFGTGNLNVNVDLVLPTGNMVVAFNPLTGAASWNYNGALALITI